MDAGLSSRTQRRGWTGWATGCHLALEDAHQIVPCLHSEPALTRISPQMRATSFPGCRVSGGGRDRGQQTSILLELWRAEVQNHDPSGGPRGGSFLPLAGLGGIQASLGLWPRPSGLCLCFLPGFSSASSPLLIKTLSSN